MDIIFKKEDIKFRYRVVAVITHNNRVLMQRISGKTVWALPGGKCELNESSIDTLKRELKEEIGVSEILNSKLLWVVENFCSRVDERVHEMSLYYKVDIKEDELICELETLEVQDTNYMLEFKWLDLDNILNEDIKPDFLKTKLNNISDEIEHIIVRE